MEGSVKSPNVAMTTFPRSFYIYTPILYTSRGRPYSDITSHCRLCSSIPNYWRCSIIPRTPPPIPIPVILTPHRLPFLIWYLAQTSELCFQRVESVVEAPLYPIPAVHGSRDKHRKGTKLRPFSHARDWKSATLPGVSCGGEIGIVPFGIVGTGFALAITLNGNHLGSGRARLCAKQRTASTVR